jgi:squalene-hopene/tetraprenyl-beta-curcumene cyclase
MRRFFVLCVAGSVTLACLPAGPLPAEEPVTLENVATPEPNQPDEPLAEYSSGKAVHFLDSAALSWQKERKCLTCHTNYAYLYASPAIGGDSIAEATVRRFAEELVEQRWPEHGPRWDAEVVATAAALAYHDAATTGTLHAATRTALDRMWTVQQENGGWNWLKCNWPPMESDDHYGATLAAIAVGVAPQAYAETPAAQAGMQRLRTYLKANPPPTVHHQAMLLWAASYTPDLMSPEERQQGIDQLRSLQTKDGGWALATLGNWQRADGTAQELEQSDGYATGFVMYVLRRGGVPADDPALRDGVNWLKTHQRLSGRWFTRSLFKDSRHFISHAGSAFAVMALVECGALSAD